MTCNALKSKMRFTIYKCLCQALAAMKLRSFVCRLDPELWPSTRRHAERTPQQLRHDFFRRAMPFILHHTCFVAGLWPNIAAKSTAHLGLEHEIFCLRTHACTAHSNSLLTLGDNAVRTWNQTQLNMRSISCRRAMKNFRGSTKVAAPLF